MSKRRSIPLDTGWHFRRVSAPATDFKPTCGFPTEIFRDLLHHNLIDDPFSGKSEDNVQWVGEEDWIYQTSFQTPPCASDEKIVLAFAGLDTFASVFLNGRKIFESDNMFLPARVDLDDGLVASNATNTLELIFKSAASKGRQIVRQHPDHVWAYSNGEESRLAVRKAQYHYVLHDQRGSSKANNETSRVGTGVPV